MTAQAYAAGVHEVKDLAGKTLGNTQAGSTYQYMAGHLLEQAGLDRAAVNYANLGKVSAVLAALTSGQIDGAIVNEPFASQLLESGQVKLLTPVGERLTYQTSAVFYAPRFAQNNDAGKRFMRAYIRACRDYYDAVFADAPVMTPAKRLETDARFREVVEIISRPPMSVAVFPTSIATVNLQPMISLSKLPGIGPTVLWNMTSRPKPVFEHKAGRPHMTV